MIGRASLKQGVRVGVLFHESYMQVPCRTVSSHLGRETDDLFIMIILFGFRRDTSLFSTVVDEMVSRVEHPTHARSFLLHRFLAQLTVQEQVLSSMVGQHALRLTVHPIIKHLVAGKQRVASIEAKLLVRRDHAEAGL